MQVWDCVEILLKLFFNKWSYSGKSKMKGISRIVFVWIEVEGDTRQQNNKKNIVKNKPYIVSVQ